MAIELTFKVDGLRKVYTGEAGMMHDGRKIFCSSMILATNSDEALAKLKEYLIQEHPEIDQVKTEWKVTLGYLIT